MSASAAGFSAEWDVATAERVARVGEWDLLFDRLDAAGCELGVGGRMRALGLVGRLAVAGAELSDPGILQSYLVPIFATSTERAGDIDTIIAHWAERAALGNSATRWRRRTASSAESDAISTVIHTDRRSMPWLAIGLAAPIVVLLVWAIGWFPSLSPEVSTSTIPQVNLPTLPLKEGWQPLLEDFLTRAAFALPILFAGLLVAGWRTAAGDRLVRRAGNADWSEQFSVAAERARWFSPIGPRKLFEALKQKLFTTTDRIDVPASVHATLRAGLAPVIENQLAEERSAYVVLVDKRGAGDHIELLAQSLVDALSAAKICFAQYDFRGRPAFCSPTHSDPSAAGPALPLNIIAKRHAGERLLLISDGEDLFEQPGWRRLRNRERLFVRPGTPVPEMKILRDFGLAVLLTPTPRAAWGPRERTLGDLGFLVVAADAEGIARVGQHIARAGEAVVDQMAVSVIEDGFISRLSAEALRYSSDIPPPPEEISNLVMDLRIWMARTVPDDPVRPGRGFLVLCGIAAFPVVTPGLTLVIATLLSRGVDGVEDAPIDSGILAPIARLPWLRNGRMPDWLRIAVLNALAQPDLDTIRALQLAVLGAAVPASGPVDSAGVDRIATGFEVAVGKSQRELDEAAARIGGGKPGEEVERIFLSVLRGERLDPVRDVISPEAPEAIQERLARPERLRRSVWIAAATAAASAIAIAEPLLSAWAAAGLSAAESLTAPIRAAIETVRLDAEVHWLGVAATLSAFGCLLAWLVIALARNMEMASRRRLLRTVRVFAVVPVVLGVASLVTNYVPNPMPLLFAVSAAIFLLFAPVARTPGVISADKIIPERIARDDWIATSLGSVFAALVFLGPLFLFALPILISESSGFTVRLSAVLLAATSWGWGSRFVRRNLLGPVVGRPTAHEQWLDFIGPLLSIMLIAAISSVLPSFGLSLGDNSHMFLIWSLSIALFGSLLTFLTLRLPKENLYIFRFVVLWTLALAISPFYGTVLDDFLRTKTTLFQINVLFNQPFKVTLEDYLVISLILVLYSIGAINKKLNFYNTIIRLTIIVTYGVGCFTLFLKITNLTVTHDQFLGLFVYLFLSAAAIFWPNLRFILMANRSVDRFSGFSQPSPKPGFAERVRAALSELRSSPWWFAPALWAVTLQYNILGLHIDPSPLAVPLAIFAGWRCGNTAATPILVGSLPFAANLNLFGVTEILTPGGFWPLVVLPLLVRIITDDGLRGRIFGRKRVAILDCAILAPCLITGIPNFSLETGLAVSVDPSWLAITVGFVIGASRMRWREPTVAFVAGLVLVAVFRLGVWALAPGVLAVAAFFGGRMWRSFFWATKEAEGRIAPSPVILGILGATGLVLAVLSLRPNILTLSPEVAEFTGRQSSFILLSLLAGIAYRRSPKLAVFAWTAVALAVGGTAAFQGQWTSGIVQGFCLSGFGLLGSQLDRHGGAAYARALGMIPKLEPLATRLEPLAASRDGLDRRVAA